MEITRRLPGWSGKRERDRFVSRDARIGVPADIREIERESAVFGSVGW